MRGVFENGEPREAKLIVDADDEIAVGQPKLQRDVFARRIWLEQRFSRGPAGRFFERLESLRRREVVHGDEDFVEGIRQILRSHQKSRERVEEIGVGDFRWREGEAIGIELRSELVEEASQQWPADAFEDAGLVEAFEFESCHVRKSLKR